MNIGDTINLEMCDFDVNINKLCFNILDYFSKSKKNIEEYEITIYNDSLIEMVSKNNTLQYDLNEKKLIRLEGFDIIDESEKFNKFMRKIKICNLLYY